MSLPLLIIVMTFPASMYTWGLVRIRKYNIIGGLCCLALGLPVDYYGTYQMYSRAGQMIWEFHPIIGLMALGAVTTELLIGLHCVVKCQIKGIEKFRTFVCWVYGIWLISYLYGAAIHLIKRS